jgi:flagellar biosynthetic protein FliR
MTWEIPLINLILGFFLVCARISGLFSVAPFFGGNNIPQRSKLAIALGLSVIFLMLHGQNFNPNQPIAASIPSLAVLMFGEFIIGLILGFAAEMLFIGVRMSGEFMSIQMGMSLAGVLDPITGQQSPVVGQFYYMVAFFMLLSLNLHHGFLMALERSFHWVPLASGLPPLNGTIEQLLAMGSNMFSLALLVAAPVMGLLLITEVSLGFVAKVMPQMNIFMVALPLKVGLGLLAIMASLPYVGDYLTHRYSELVRQLMQLFGG